MKFTFDQDFHIHSRLSACSDDPAQSPESILRYGEENNLKQLVLTDHFWDENVPMGHYPDAPVPGAPEWYMPQNYAHICAARPLPQSEKCQFLFGCETEMDKYGTIGVSRERMEEMDFFIVPTTHLHMDGFTYAPADGVTAEGRRKLWTERLEHLLSLDLPFRKMGVAHLACGLIAPKREMTLAVLAGLPEADMKRLFQKAAKLGIGIELNSDDMKFKDEEADIVLRPFRAAKEAGCLFYCGSDAHHPENFDRVGDIFRRAIDYLELDETQKFKLS